MENCGLEAVLGKAVQYIISDFPMHRDLFINEPGQAKVVILNLRQLPAQIYSTPTPKKLTKSKNYRLKYVSLGFER